MALIKCKECGKEISDRATVCPNCGYNNHIVGENLLVSENLRKNKIIAGLLCLFLWGVGAHEFYLGSIKKAILWILLSIAVGVMALMVPMFYLLYLVPIVLAIRFFVMSQDEFDLKYNTTLSPKSQIGCLIGILIAGFIFPLILGILAAIAMPQYFRALEKARSRYVISLENAVFDSQKRYYSNAGNYATTFDKLDLSFTDKNGTPVGAVPSFESENYTISLGGVGDKAYIEADRNGGRFLYKIRRYYKDGKMECISEQHLGVCNSLLPPVNQ